jgi:hypothetical protein
VFDEDRSAGAVMIIVIACGSPTGKEYVVGLAEYSGQWSGEQTPFLTMSCPIAPGIWSDAGPGSP